MKRLNLILALMLLGIVAVGAQTVKVTAKVDSVDTMQGKLRQIDVSVLQTPEMLLEWTVSESDNPLVVEELYPSIEIRHISEVDTIRDGELLELRRSLLVQPWDSGEYVIPGIALIANSDTFRSNDIVLKVLPAWTDTMTTIATKEYMPVIESESQFWDWLPDFIYDYWWLILLYIVVIAGIVLVYLIQSKRIVITKFKPQEIIVPPYDKAMMRLNELQSRNLCEKGQEKEYYTLLTEILREYLEGRFGIFAMEMTTPQIKKAVYAAVPAKTASRIMNEILEMADYVKFARMRPLPEDNMRAYSQALEFVENTKPEEVVTIEKVAKK